MEMEKPSSLLVAKKLLLIERIKGKGGGNGLYFLSCSALERPINYKYLKLTVEKDLIINRNTYIHELLRPM